MQPIHRLIFNICSSNLVESKSFYTTLFDFTVGFESDWFINLKSQSQPYEIGIIEKENDLAPSESRNNPTGVYLTFVEEDVEATYQLAKSLNFEILQAPEDTFYGQRRMLLKDPDGLVVDVSSLIKQG